MSYHEEENVGTRQWLKVGLVLLCFAVALAVLYNGMIEKEEDVKLARSNVENMMQRRMELIPDLVKVVEEFTKHEEKVFEDVANARIALADCLDSGNIAKIDEADSELSRQINQLIAIAEDYPELTSGQHYINLMDQLEGSVNRIAIAREDYNVAVGNYNRAIRKLPYSIYAKIFGFEVMETFEADEAAKQFSMVHFGD